MEIPETDLVPPDHPCLQGHFPGNPLVPGTVILEKVIDRLTGIIPDQHVTEIISVKFLAPLKPGERFSVSFSQTPDKVQFECLRNDKIIASGSLSIAANG